MIHIILGLLLGQATAELVHVSIAEELPIGSAVYQLRFPGEYSLYDVNEQYFALSFDGRITTKSRIDRESEPFNDPENPYELKVRHSQTLIQVLVNVIDINDNKPLFKIKQETFAFSENAQIGDEKTLPEAVDIDYGINSTQGYRIVSGNTDNTFEIVSFKAGSRKFYYLRLKRGLDRERTPSFTLTIEAYDGAYPAKKDTLEVQIIVEDENDCSPEFNQTHYYASVREDANIGYKIITVKATDDDSGPNSDIVYSIDRDFYTDNKFMINRNTGDITLQGPLDYEEEKEIFLAVKATDKGVPPRETKVFVSIKVVDVNDNQPQIEIIYKSASDTEAQVDEDASPDSPVVAIRVTDADDDEAGRVTCEMDSENGMEYFKLVHNDDIVDMWNVRVKKPPRRDVAKEFTLSITCRDNGSPEQKISFMSFKVKIMDINDHYPIFDSVSYEISIPENTSPGTDIISVSASDADDGDFGDITYKIASVSAQDSSADPMSWFSITPKGGVIRNLVKLDRERTPDITMIVQAIDGGTPPNGPHIATATVTINLLDENDNIPWFSDDFVETSVKNNVVIGTKVVQVTARDLDDGAYGSVEYSLEGDSEAARLFKIHPTTGTITVAQALPDTDYQVVSLVVVATDGGDQQGRCEVEISIFGDNLYPPVLGEEEYTTSVNENTSPPKVLFTVTATDQDTMYFGEIHYELAGSHDNKFAIDRNTGELRLINSLDYETKRQYNFEVRAVNNPDGSPTRMEDRATVTIYVNDINDEPPQFAFDRYNLTAFSEDNNGTIIGIIKAVDPDSADTGMVTYRIVGGNEQKLFKLISTPQGAEIRINGNLAYMVGKDVNVILEAQDDNPNTFNGQQTVLWITIEEGEGPGEFEKASSEKTWLDRYLPFLIGAVVLVSLVFIVIIVVVCNRANNQHKLMYAPAKLPAYEYEYADLDEQYGLEPDTVKAYNIDGGGECDRLSAFEALTNQLQNLQQDYMSDKGYGNYYGYNEKKMKSHIDSEGYFSLSDPAFNEPDKGHMTGGDIPGGETGDRSLTLNTLLNSQNIYSNMPQPDPVKCDSSKYVPLSPPPESQGSMYRRHPGEQEFLGRPAEQDFLGRPSPDCGEFVRSLPPLDNNFLPMSPELSPPPLESDPPSRDEAPTRSDHIASLSSLISSQSRPSEIRGLPTSLMAPNQETVLRSRDLDNNIPRTDTISLNSEHSVDF